MSAETRKRAKILIVDDQDRMSPAREPAAARWLYNAGRLLLSTGGPGPDSRDVIGSGQRRPARLRRGRAN